jgi:hypothetical protein
MKNSTADARHKKREEIAKYYHVRGPFLFVHVNLLDNRSEFSPPLEATIRKEDNDYFAEVYDASIALHFVRRR